MSGSKEPTCEAGLVVSLLPCSDDSDCRLWSDLGLTDLYRCADEVS